MAGDSGWMSHSSSAVAQLCAVSGLCMRKIHNTVDVVLTITLEPVQLQCLAPTLRRANLLYLVIPVATFCLLRRRKLSQASMLSVGVAASGFASTNSASQALQGFTDALGDGRLQNQMLTLASLSVSSVAYTQPPTITTSLAVVAAVPAPGIDNGKKKSSGMVLDAAD